jgi:hypothetical protein
MVYRSVHHIVSQQSAMNVSAQLKLNFTSNAKPGCLDFLRKVINRPSLSVDFRFLLLLIACDKLCAYTAKLVV